MKDQRDVYATFVSILLVPLEGGIAALGPTPWVVGMAVGSTDFFNLIDEVFRRVKNTVEELHFVHYAERSAFL